MTRDKNTTCWFYFLFDVCFAGLSSYHNSFVSPCLIVIVFIWVVVSGLRVIKLWLFDIHAAVNLSRWGTAKGGKISPEMLREAVGGIDDNSFSPAASTPYKQPAQSESLIATQPDQPLKQEAALSMDHREDDVELPSSTKLSV